MSITVEPRDRGVSKYRTAVSLHSHTLHSRETLAFCYRLAKRYASARRAVSFLEREFRKSCGGELDLRRGWWTPPLTAHAAWNLERQRIEDGMGLQALVSLSDHDDIDAPMTLRVLSAGKAIPVSVEWTVPFEDTFFHLGIHNMPVEQAREMLSAFHEYTRQPGASRLAELLEWSAAASDGLVVFNHPCWDECGIGEGEHALAVRRFAAKYGQFVHAIELNGLRPWAENQRAIELARRLDRPVISGGDRHGIEPNAILNLTNARRFDEFVDEIRNGVSNVLVTDSYRESYAMRIVQNFEEMARDLPGHGLGWKRWSDRVFYQGDDRIVRSLAEVFGRVPQVMELPFRLLQMFRYPKMRRAMRFALPRSRELSLL